MQSQKTEKKSPALLTRFAHYYKPHMVLFVADLAAALAIAICDLFYPMVTRSIINVYVPSKDLQLFLTWIAVLAGIYILKAGLNYFVAYWGHLVGARMQSDMRKDLFRHMQSLPFSYFDDNRTGNLMSRIVNDLFEITELAHHGPEDLFISVISFLGAFIILARIDLLLTLIIFVFLPLVLIFAVLMRTRMRRAFMRRREETSAMNAEIENSLSGIRVAKAFTNSAYEQEKFDHRTNEYFKASANAYKVMATYVSGMGFCTDVMSLAALAAAGLSVFWGRIDIGDFAAFLLYIGMFVQPVRRLNQFVEQFQDGMSGFRRFAEVMAVPPEENPGSPARPKVVEGDIRFEAVSFSYGEAGEVLHDISLHIPAGKTAALVGPSGGGKTTLCHLIPRFYQPQAGKILLDGTDISLFDYTELRRSIGIVQQDVFIFAGTVYENIAYGRLNASREDVIQAARDANLHEYICALPDGYDTNIGERGSKLSGGQKQRIAIARVFLKNPPILILDEATSALDNATEMSIQQEFDRLAKNRTTVVVAHRLSTVRNADIIFVLTEDGIVERGSHTQLLANPDGLYRTLYETQFSAFE